MSETFNGGCACGRVRYEMASEPIFTQACHCRDCQRQSGTAFAHNAMIETDRLKVDGATDAVTLPTPSGGGQVVVRCTACKTALFSHYGGSDKVAFLRVGTLDDPDAFPPQIHVWTKSRQPWVVLPDDAPQAQEYYRAGDVWPREALARRKALSN
jgi:hypothetical protein